MSRFVMFAAMTVAVVASPSASEARLAEGAKPDGSGLRTRRLYRLVAASALIWLAFDYGLCASAIGLSHDQPRIIPWHQIGDIGIGMPKGRVLSEYGAGQTIAGLSDLRVYRVRGGILRVQFSKGRVQGVRTNSRRYRTPGGFGVGSRIPIPPPSKWGGYDVPPCKRVGIKGRMHCYTVWNGFSLDPHEYVWAGRKFTASLYVDSTYALVEAIEVGTVY